MKRSLIKVIKDHVVKALLGKESAPIGLVDLNKYFRLYGAINFDLHKGNGIITAVSNNFKYGSIVTNGRTNEELESNIKDAILTSFEVPSSYKEEAKIVLEGEKKNAYALA